MASNVYKISVRRGPDEGKSFPLSSDSVTVGRDPMAEVIFSDPEVSRQHARFTKSDEGYQLQDLGSTNGTFVDGKRLGGEIVTLQPGAVITMGSNVTVVYEAAPDPMATVISPDLDLAFMEEDEPQADVDNMDELRTMIETPEPDDDVFPGFDDALDDVDELDYDSESTSLEYPAASEPQQFAAEEDDAFSFDFDDVDYGEPVSPAAGVAADQRTVLDMEASDFSSYGSQSTEDDSLPSFEKSSDLPSFDDEPAYAPSPAMKAGSQTPPPPPPAAPVKEANPDKRRNTIIAVVVLLLLCCCCSIALSYFYLGDVLLEYFQF